MSARARGSAGIDAWGAWAEGEAAVRWPTWQTVREIEQGATNPNVADWTRAMIRKGYTYEWVHDQLYGREGSRDHVQTPHPSVSAVKRALATRRAPAAIRPQRNSTLTRMCSAVGRRHSPPTCRMALQTRAMDPSRWRLPMGC